MTALTGLYVPLITPFDSSGEVALSALESLAHNVLDEGATGLVTLATTSEPGSLNPAEQAVVLDVVARVCADRQAPLIVGANSAADLAELRGRAEVVAALTLVPPFVRPGEDGVVAYFTQLCATSPVPVMVYHIPYRTGQELSPAAIHRLAELPGVVGVKYAPGTIAAPTLALLADPPPGLSVLCGDDPLISSLAALGASGAIAASALVATAEFARLLSAWRAGDVATARPLGHRLTGLATALFVEPNPTVIKAVLHAQGRIPSPSVRLPLVAAAEASRCAAEAALAGLSTN